MCADLCGRKQVWVTSCPQINQRSKHEDAKLKTRSAWRLKAAASHFSHQTSAKKTQKKRFLWEKLVQSTEWKHVITLSVMLLCKRRHFTPLKCWKPQIWPFSAHQWGWFQHKHDNRNECLSSYQRLGSCFSVKLALMPPTSRENLLNIYGEDVLTAWTFPCDATPNANWLNTSFIFLFFRDKKRLQMLKTLFVSELFCFLLLSLLKERRITSSII